MDELVLICSLFTHCLQQIIHKDRVVVCLKSICNRPLFCLQKLLKSEVGKKITFVEATLQCLNSICVLVNFDFMECRFNLVPVVDEFRATSTDSNPICLILRYNGLCGSCLILIWAPPWAQR